jgi:hypothetical protein
MRATNWPYARKSLACSWKRPALCTFVTLSSVASAASTQLYAQCIYLPVITLTHPRTVDNAQANASALAKMISGALNMPVFVGPHPANGQSCTMCGRAPPSDMLYKIVVDVINDQFVLIGIDICTTQHLVDALNELLAAEMRNAHRHRSARIRRLEDALAVIDR